MDCSGNVTLYVTVGDFLGGWFCGHKKRQPYFLQRLPLQKSRLSDLNQPPARYECAALPDELSRRNFNKDTRKKACGQ